MKRSGDITGLIDKAYDEEIVKPYHSKGSIGASAVGNTCDALLAFSLRGFPDGKNAPKMKRIFRDGHRLEDVVLKDMTKAGIHVMATNPGTNKQWEWRKYGELAVFKADGVIENVGVPLLLEIKSMNSDLHDKFKRVGVRVSHPYYYDQVQMGMGLSGIHRCVLVGYNKDNSNYWDEIIEFDPIRFGVLMWRIEQTFKGPAVKIGREETDWRCRRCFKAGVCWKPEAIDVAKTFRTCGNSIAGVDGRFVCAIGYSLCDATTCKDYVRWKPEERK